MDKILENIIKEAKRIEEDCKFSSVGHWMAARRWNKIHLLIGCPAAVISAISGVTLLSDNIYSKQVGVVSLFIAVLTGILTFLNPNEKKNLHHEAGSKFNSLRQKIRIFADIECLKEITNEELEKKLKELANIKIDLNLKYPDIPPDAYKKAKKSIERGEANHSIDEK